MTKRRPQPVQSREVEPSGPQDAVTQAAEGHGPWFTAESGARYLDFTGKDRVDAFRVWAKRAGVPVSHRGRRVLYHRSDLLRAIGASHRKLA